MTKKAAPRTFARASHRVSAPSVEVTMPSPQLQLRRIRQALAVIQVLVRSNDLLIRGDVRTAVVEMAEDAFGDACRLVDRLPADGAR